MADSWPSNRTSHQEKVVRVVFPAFASALYVLIASGLLHGEVKKPLAPTTGFLNKKHTDAQGREHDYVLFVPKLDPAKSAPLIVFLHGAGERAGGSKRPVEVGIGPYIKKYPENDFPFFVLIPQCDKERNWIAGGADAERVMAMLKAVEKEYKIDAKRIYLTGLSMGGYGTWSLANAYPTRWAAIVPICGGGDKEWVKNIKHIPCWCWHGDADRAVSVERSREMIKGLQDAGGVKPRYSELKGIGHNSWDTAYSKRELYDWMLSHNLQ
jgi:predicted peptidase